MTIIIPIEELENDYQKNWKLEKIKGVSIDYATNSINGFFEDTELILFKFKDYGFIHDNRFNTYQISIGPAGILIQVKKTR
jgi:hypothetical protein